MDRYIGLDANASSCTLGVMTPSVQRIGSHVVETNARCLIEAVRQIPQPRHICLAEETLSEWLYEVLSPHAEKVVLAAVSEGRGPKDDRRDAFGLAEGSVPVTKDPGAPQFLANGLVRWVRRLTWKLGGRPDMPDHPAGEPDPKVKIQPFPRDFQR